MRVSKAAASSVTTTLCIMVLACGSSSTDNNAQPGGGTSGATAGTTAVGGAGAASVGGAMGGGAGGTAGASGAGQNGGVAGGGASGTSGSAGVAGGAGGGAGGSSGASGAAGNAGQAGAGGATGVGCAGAALCWNFEEGAIPPGWGTDLRPMDFNGSISVDNSKPHDGTYSLHMAGLSGGTVGQAGGPKKSMQYMLPANFGPVMWGRAYVFTTPERPMSHAGFFNARYPGPTSQGAWETLDWYEVASYMQNYMSIWHPPEPPGFPEWVKVSDTPLVIDAWTCVEWLFDAQNGAEAVPADPRVWLDGTELLWPTEFTFDNSGTDKPDPPAMEKGTNFTMIETGAWFYQGVTTPTDYWIDDLAIGPERIGCSD